MVTSGDDEGQLSRAVSAVDLNASLTAVKERDNKGALPVPHPHSGKKSDRTGVFEIGLPDGIMTPPYQAAPNPPPPTPASPGSTVKPEHTKETSGGANELPDEDEPKKTKNKKNGRVKKPKPTGFEEFFADTPITPYEYEEERSIYDQSHQFADRIQTCIQRFRGRRKLDEVRNNVLNKYLSLGGVETCIKQFTGGLDRETLETSTAAEIAAIKATDFVRTGVSKVSKYYDGSENWVVDFEGVAKGFLVPTIFNTDTDKEIQTYCAVIRNFLNYVILHDVCPEYMLDIMAARKIVALAEKELCAIREIRANLPGNFNIAASTLYGGHYKDAWYEIEDWEITNYAQSPPSKVARIAEAERVFKAAINWKGDQELFTQVSRANVHIVNTQRRFFEVVNIVRPDLCTLEKYANVTSKIGETSYIKPLGVVHLKRWEGPELENEDCTDDEYEAEDDEAVVESFWLEDELLKILYLGLKLDVVVSELNIGIKFIDVVRDVYCSFYTNLLNEKMTGYKEPVLSNRSPPIEDDPKAEKRILDATKEADVDENEKIIQGK